MPEGESDSPSSRAWENHLMSFTRPSQFALFFMRAFTSGWPQQQVGAQAAYGQDWIRIQKHFCYLSFSSDKTQQEPPISGIRCNRVHDIVSLPSSHPTRQFALRECRYSIALSARIGTMMPFVVVTLFDGQENRPLRTELGRESCSPNRGKLFLMHFLLLLTNLSSL